MLRSILGSSVSWNKAFIMASRTCDHFFRKHLLYDSWIFPHFQREVQMTSSYSILYVLRTKWLHHTVYFHYRSAICIVKNIKYSPRLRYNVKLLYKIENELIFLYLDPSCRFSRVPGKGYVCVCGRRTYASVRMRIAAPHKDSRRWRCATAGE